MSVVATAAHATLWVVLQAGEEIDLDYSPYGSNDIQFAISVVVAFAVVVLSSLFIRFYSSRILDDEESEHAKTIANGLKARDWFKLRIPHDADVDEYRPRIRAGLEGDFDADVPTVRAALGEVRGVFRDRRRAAGRAVSDELPALSRALSLDAVLYLVAGVVVHESLSTWGRLLTTSSTPPAPAVMLDRAASVAASTADTLVSIAASYPFAGDLWAFGFVAVMEIGRYVYDNVYGVTAVLLAGSFFVWSADKAIANDVEPRIYRSRPSAVVGLGATLVSTWFTGVAVAVGLESVLEPVSAAAPVTIDAALWGATAGLLASLVVFALMARRTLRAAYDRLTLAYFQADDDGVGPTGTVVYIAGRKLFGAVGLLAAGVLPFYLLEAVTSGKAAAILEIALVESSTQVRATAAFVLVALLVFTIVQTRPAWGELAKALRTSLDRQGLRLALASRGFPLLAVVLAFPIAYGSGFFGLLDSLMLAVGVALTIKVFFYLQTRAELAYFDYSDEPPKPGRVWVEGVVVEDARGREIGVVKTNGSGVAAPLEPVGDGDAGLPAGGLDELVEQVVEDTKTIFEGYEHETDPYRKHRPRPSVFSYYFDRIQNGRVDFRRVRAEYLGSIGKAIEAEIEKAGREGVENGRLDELMSREFDPELYRRKLLEERKKPDGVAVYGDRVKSN